MPIQEEPPRRQSPEVAPEQLLGGDKNDRLLRELEEKNEQLGKLLNDYNHQLEQERKNSRELLCKLKEMEIRRNISENMELVDLREKLHQCKLEFKRRLELMEQAKERSEMVLNEERRRNCAHAA